MKNRPNAYSQPGGDTVVMERIAQGIRQLGVNVDIDLDSVIDPANYNLVHLFNFATPSITEEYARLCVKRKLPYVVTTMYEDLPSFYGQMSAVAKSLIEYVNCKQPINKWVEFKEKFAHFSPSGHWKNDYTAINAACLVATGERERSALLKDYPNAKVDLYKCGCNVIESNTRITMEQNSDSGQLFRSYYNVSDFVLCVGRLESRKNQLMLLKALEESNLTLVFATGGFSYQPDYEDACKNFKRAGKTVFLDKLEPEMLLSAYYAAKTHVLPSWYELPGLVSLEAAKSGRNIVVCDRGTPKDYFGNKAFYCSPDDEQSIFQAVMGAYHCPSISGIDVIVSDLTWHNASKRYVEIYEKVLGFAILEKNVSDANITLNYNMLDDAIDTIENAKKDRNYQAALDQSKVILRDLNITSEQIARVNIITAEALACSGNIAEAKEAFYANITHTKVRSRAMAGLGALELYEDKREEAKHWFNLSLSLDNYNDVAKAGLAYCISIEGKKNDAWRLYIEAIEINPENLNAILGIIDLGYQLKLLPQVEDTLRKYLSFHPADTDILYSLAGCLFAQNRFNEARTELEKILTFNPLHNMSTELLAVIDSRSNEHIAVCR